MKNTIQITVEFSFKGEAYRPSMVVDLDQLVQDGDMPDLHDLHDMLAMQNGIDTYSYAFEVMQQAPLCFDQAEGLARECLRDGVLDIALFIEKHQEAGMLGMLQEVASRELGIEDLDGEPKIRDALIQAYSLGKSG